MSCVVIFLFLKGLEFLNEKLFPETKHNEPPDRRAATPYSPVNGTLYYPKLMAMCYFVYYHES